MRTKTTPVRRIDRKFEPKTRLDGLAPLAQSVSYIFMSQSLSDCTVAAQRRNRYIPTIALDKECYNNKSVVSIHITQ